MPEQPVACDGMMVAAKSNASMSKFSKRIAHTGVIHVHSTRNNTILTLTDMQGNTRFWTSAGCLGVKHARKSTSYAAQAAAEVVAAKAVSLGFVSVIVKLKGLGYGKESCVRAFYKSPVRVMKLMETTPIPHNGCRRPKARRV
jgi:small subunit ribosomal protein S11